MSSPSPAAPAARAPAPAAAALAGKAGVATIEEIRAALLAFDWLPDAGALDTTTAPVVAATSPSFEAVASASAAATGANDASQSLASAAAAAAVRDAHVSARTTAHWPRPLTSIIVEYARSVFVVVGGYDWTAAKGVVRWWSPGTTDGRALGSMYWSPRPISRVCAFEWRGFALCAVACDGPYPVAIVDVAAARARAAADGTDENGDEADADGASDDDEDDADGDDGDSAETAAAAAAGDTKQQPKPKKKQKAKAMGLAPAPPTWTAMQQYTALIEQTLRKQQPPRKPTPDSPVWASFVPPERTPPTGAQAGRAPYPRTVRCFLWLDAEETLLVAVDDGDARGRADVYPFHVPSRTLGARLALGSGCGPTHGMCEMGAGPAGSMTPGSGWMALASNGDIQFWNRRTGADGPTLVGREYGLTSLAYWGGARRVLLDGQSACVTLWARDTFEEVRTLRYGADVLCVLDADRLALSSTHTFHVLDLRARTAQEITAFTGRTKVTGMCLVPHHPDWLVVTATGGDGHGASDDTDTPPRQPTIHRWGSQSTWVAPKPKPAAASAVSAADAAAGGRSARLIKVYDTRTASRVSLFRIPERLKVCTVASVAL